MQWCVIDLSVSNNVVIVLPWFKSGSGSSNLLSSPQTSMNAVRLRFFVDLILCVPMHQGPSTALVLVATSPPRGSFGNLVSHSAKVSRPTYQTYCSQECNSSSMKTTIQERDSYLTMSVRQYSYTLYKPSYIFTNMKVSHDNHNNICISIPKMLPRNYDVDRYEADCKTYNKYHLI